MKNLKSVTYIKEGIGMFGLKVRLYLLIALMFGIVYAITVVLIPGRTFAFYALLATFFLFLQYFLSPAMVEIAMRVRYVSEEEYPDLHRMVEELARKAGIPKPRVGVSDLPIPNAFAFGRSIKDGRVVVTEEIMRLLTKEELKAVLGHEISHLKHRDVVVITMLSLVPMICWYIAWSFMWGFGDERERGYGVIIGMIAFFLYFITNLLVLYASRVREYYADYGSVELGNPPHHLASALYKLVYGTASIPKEYLRPMEGFKAFFLNDPSKAYREIYDLKQIDLDMSGSIEREELLWLKNKEIKLSFTDKLMELLSTHPNMLERIKFLSKLA